MLPGRTVLLLGALLLLPIRTAHAQQPQSTPSDPLQQQKIPHTELRTVIFHTSPDGALVERSGPNGEVLGRSGQQLQIAVPMSMNVPLTFVFEHDGYQKARYTVDSSSLKEPLTYNLPDDGSDLLLLPANMAVYFRDLAIRHLVVSTVGICGIVLGVWGVRRHLQLVVKRAQRAATLDTLGVGNKAAPSTVEEFSMVGQRLGNWILTDKLGKGGMAVVYRAIPNETLDTTQAVAVKVINPASLSNPESKARFEREVRIGAKLNHPNIVRLIDWDVTGPFYLVMELIDGVSMRKRVIPDGMAPRLALELMMPIFDAMIYAHEQGVWHRDLKPENIFISKGNRMTVMDFGISRQATDVTVTGTDQMPVTPGYMSPEQFTGKNVAAPADQYTLGIMMWELMVGHRPFEDESPLVVVMRHVGTPLPSMRDAKPEIPEEVDWVIDRMCAKDPLQRYPDLQSAVQALEEAIIGV